MTETEAGRNTGANPAPRSNGKPAHAADDPERRVNGSTTALADPQVGTDSTTIIPRIPADGEPPAAESATPVPTPRPGRSARPHAEQRDERAAGAGHTPDAEPFSGGERPARVRGTTAVAEDVVEKIVSFAAEQVDGMFDLGGDVAAAISSVREPLGIGEVSSRRGIHVQVDGRQARITLTLVVQFGHPAMQVAEQVRENVIAAVETMLTIDVVECNVIIDDVHVGD